MLRTAHNIKSLKEIDWNLPYKFRNKIFEFIINNST